MEFFLRIHNPIANAKSVIFFDVLVSTIILYLTLALCAFGVGLMVHKYDLYLREPIHMIFLSIALGALFMWVATNTQIELIRAASRSRMIVTDPSLALLAGATEELGKLLVVLLIALPFRRIFNEPLDGIVYGSFAGLGAALIESIWVISGERHLTFLPPQEPVRLAGHVVMGGIGGFGVGLLTMQRRYTFALIILCYFAAVLLHTLWDAVAFSAANHYRMSAKVRAEHSIAAVVIMLVGMVSYRRLIAIGARLTRMKLQVCDVATKRCPPD